MKRSLAKWVAVCVITMALAGCAGGLGVGTLLGLVDISVGDVIAEIGQGLFGIGTPTETGTARVFLNGHLIDEISAGDANVSLRGLPEGRHLLHVTATDFRGVARVVDVRRNRETDVDLSEPYEGGLIRGRVELDTDGRLSNAARVLVYAIPDGIEVLEDGDDVRLPGNEPPFAIYTSEDGAFTFRALPRNRDYLIIAAVAGYATDMRLVRNLAERQRRENVNLTLSSVPGLSPGRVIGVVQSEAEEGAASRRASLRAQLHSDPYVPAVPETTAERIMEDTEITELAAFRFEVLATLTDERRAYRLPLMPGKWQIECFEFGHRGRAGEVEVRSGQRTTADFHLERYD